MERFLEFERNLSFHQKERSVFVKKYLIFFKIGKRGKFIVDEIQNILIFWNVFFPPILKVCNSQKIFKFQTVKKLTNFFSQKNYFHLKKTLHELWILHTIWNFKS